MKIRKAVFTAAGLGTRLLPATKAQPKEMLPLVDKPIIQYVVEEAVAAGIEQIIIVTGRGKRAIEDHFDVAFELEYYLKQKHDTEALREVRKISELANTVTYIRQKEPLGIGHAILVTKEIVGNEPFAVLFPDDLINARIPCLKQMTNVFEKYKCSVLAVQQVERSAVSRYGIISPKQIEERVYQVTDLVEKPKVEDAPSNLGIVGRYILTPEIFECLERTPPGKGGEIQITDGLRLLLQQQAIYGYEFEGTRYDTGNKLGFLKASVEMALQRPDLGDDFRRYLKSLDLIGAGGGNGRKGIGGAAMTIEPSDTSMETPDTSAVAEAFHTPSLSPTPTLARQKYPSWPPAWPFMARMCTSSMAAIASGTYCACPDSATAISVLGRLGASPCSLSTQAIAPTLPTCRTIQPTQGGVPAGMNVDFFIYHEVAPPPWPTVGHGAGAQRHRPGRAHGRRARRALTSRSKR